MSARDEVTAPSCAEVEWGVRLDELGSTDTYKTEAAARAALADGDVLVKITITVEEVRP